MRSRRTATVIIALALAACLGVAEASATALVVQSITTSDYPRVEMLVAIPGSMSQDGEPRFSVKENAVTRKVLSAEPLSSESRKPVDVVLVLDASGSMEGVPLREAQAAARRFVAGMGPADRIAVIAFSERAKVLTGFTSDRARIDAAIASVQAKGETALYDSLVTAAKLLGPQNGAERYVVLLSDGGDTVSAASITTAVDRLVAAGAPVYAVALASPEYDPKAIAAVPRSTHGTLLSVKDATQLGSIFQRIAREIRGVWRVVYVSAKPDSPDIEVELKARAGDITASSMNVIDNPRFAAGTGEVLPVKFGAFFVATGWGIATIIGLAVALAAVGLAILLRREGPAIDQLAYYNQIRQRDDRAARRAGASDSDSLTERFKSAIAVVASEKGVAGDLRVRLERAGVKLRPDEFIYMHLLSVFAVSVGVEVLLRSWPLAMLAVLITTFVPFLVLSMRASHRRSTFESQLPDVISLIAGSLRAGWGIQQALDLIVDEVAEPAASEFRRVQSETRLGLALEESLSKMAERLDSDDFRWVVSAIGIQREVGGNLAEVLDITAGTIRERAELRREVSALTAEGRFSAIVLVLLPFVMFFAMMFVAPKYLNSMIGSVYGWGLLGLAGFMLTVGSMWLYRVSKVVI